MALIRLFVFFSLTRLVLLSSAEEENDNLPCPSFHCGPIPFPLNNKTHPECSMLRVDDCSEDIHTIQLKEGGHWYQIENISQAHSIIINETLPRFKLDPHNCESIKSFSLPSSTPSLSFYFTGNHLTLYNCSQSTGGNITDPPRDFSKTVCEGFDIYYHLQNSGFPFEKQCSVIQLPLPEDQDPQIDNIPLLNTRVIVEVFVAPYCHHCQRDGWECRTNNKNLLDCPNARKGHGKKLRLGLGLGLGLGVPLALILVILVIFVWRWKQNRAASKLTRNISDQYINSDTEEGSDYLGVLVFSYKDLQEATYNFNAEKELGDGGFGTVYYGKLKDGREVAVKRLYEHNYKRVEQFINEIEILTRLRHKNLVSLYGCTSRRCRELLLVYEYIPNGTVADHLHGDRAKTGPLKWPIRMSIAIETASALAYLHASDIVHRDVKTNNILLDNNFCVKVADFGLSRLFPNDVTHVSTAPQGTPGYVDPEYHQCYQLTSKSDVYSFGVVLVELISSMPAVDITRHRHEINLSNLALSKIQKRAYNELVDPCLGFDTDIEVKTMIIAVAELAFQCLQQDKEMRPSMDEVLETLKAIEIGNSESENHQKEEAFDGSGLSMSTVRPPSPDCDEVVLLKRMKQEHPPSPNTVTENWPSSRSTTPNISG